MAGVDDNIIEEVRRTGDVATVIQHKLLNAAPPVPVKALDDGVSAMDDPDVAKYRRGLRLARAEKLACWEDQIEQYILEHDGLARRDEYRREVEDGKREEEKMSAAERSKMFEFPYHHQQVFALLADKQKVWKAKWKKTDADITAMAEEFKDIRRPCLGDRKALTRKLRPRSRWRSCG